MALTVDTSLITADGGISSTPLGSFTTLRTQVLDYLDRPELSGQFPFWVSLFQSKLNRLLRISGGENQVTLTPDPVTGGALLPADYQAWRSVESAAAGRSWPLDYATPDALARHASAPEAGIPRLFTIQGTTLFPKPSGVVTLTYYRGVPPYVFGALSDWVLTGNPDIYLYGLLSEAEKYLKNDERSAIWLADAATALNDLINADHDARWGRAKIKMSGATP